MSDAITAGAALIASGIDLAEVRAQLPRVEPYAVTIRPARPWFRRFWARGISAIAMPWGVYVTDAVFARIAANPEPERDGRLVVHELTHLEQFRRLGALRHLTQYVGDYLRARFSGATHWAAYRGIRLEVEAREVAARFEVTGGPR